MSYDVFSVQPTLIIDKKGIKRGIINDTKVEDDKIKGMQKCVIMLENYSLEKNHDLWSICLSWATSFGRISMFYFTFMCIISK